MSQIRRAETKIQDIDQALTHLAQAASPNQAEFSILFVSPSYDTQALAAKIPKYLGHSVYGCTTAGEIGPSGYLDDSISIVSFHGREFAHQLVFLDNLKEMSDRDIQHLETAVSKSKVIEKSLGQGAKTFAFMLIDGLSVREELITAQIGLRLGDIPLVGGSAGDKLKFGHTWVWNGSSFTENSALVLLISTSRPFETFKTQHFSESDSKIVVTASDPENRVVTEINGMPAAEAYAEAVGLKVEKFTPMVFSKYPVMLKIGDEFFVRSIQKVNPDKSLTFYCAIDDGIVLTVGKKLDFLGCVEAEFDRIKKKVGEIDASLLCECILRKLEVEDMPPEETQRVQSLYSKNQVVGFHTYGEQFGTLHINQTLTGVAFGKAKT
jgi:hypothetical protein